MLYSELTYLFTYQGVREYSKPISLEDKVKIDLVIVGSVAVSKSGKGQVRNFYLLVLGQVDE